MSKFWGFLMPGSYALGWGLGDAIAHKPSAAAWIIGGLASWAIVALWALSEHREG